MTTTTPRLGPLPPVLEPTPAIVAAVRALVAARRRYDTLPLHADPRQATELGEACQLARVAVERAMPQRAGWYPIDGRLWGWSKVNRFGLSLVDRGAACPWPRRGRGAR